MPRLSNARCALIAMSVVVGGWSVSAFGQSNTLRIVSYNIDADTTDFEANGVPLDDVPGTPRLKTVLQAIGAEKLGGGPLTGTAHPIDVMAITEPYKTPATTLAAIAADLNSIYNTTTYTYDAFVPAGYTNASSTGNAPSGLVYNSATVVDVAHAGIGSQNSTSGAARIPMRYTLKPFAVQNDPNSTFYLYVEHGKALGDTQSTARRTNEAVTVRQDADSLGANAHIIFSGDFNFDLGSSEQAYKNMVAPSGATLVGESTSDGGSTFTATNAGIAGPGRAVDPVNPANNWTNGSSSTNKNLFTDASGHKPGSSTGGLTSRLDFELVSTAVAGNTSPGLQLVPNTYTAFGNDTWTGPVDSTTITYNQPVNFSSTALADLPNQGAVLNALSATFTDHLPVVADYSFASLVPEPASLGFVVLGISTLMRRRRSIDP